MAKHPKLKYGLGMFVPFGLGSTWDFMPAPRLVHIPEMRWQMIDRL